MTLKHIKLAAIAALVLFMTSCDSDDDDDNNPGTQPEAKGIMHIKIDHEWGPNQDHFHLGEAYVHPENDDTLTFNKLNYFISNIKLYQADGTEWAQEESYHFIELGQGHMGSSLEINIDDVPQGNYTSMSYMIGVDSTRNVSGAQTGALDPATGMFWSWTTGYIFVKYEGESVLSSSGQFSYHLGGFEGTRNAIQNVSHDFQGATLEIMPNANPSVHLIVDPSKLWQDGFSSAQQNMLHMPGDMAVMLAGNVAEGFRYDHIHN